MAQQSGNQPMVSKVSPLRVSSGKGREPENSVELMPDNRSGRRLRRRQHQLRGEGGRTSSRRPGSSMDNSSHPQAFGQRPSTRIETLSTRSLQRQPSDPPVNPFAPTPRTGRTPQLGRINHRRRAELESPLPQAGRLANRNRRGNRRQISLVVTPEQTDARRFQQRPSQQPAQPSTNRSSRRRSRPSALLYGTRLLILGVGIGAIAGTILSVWDPATRKLADASQTQAAVAGAGVEQKQGQTPTDKGQQPVQLSQEIVPLKAQIQALVAKNPKLQPGVFLVDLETGAYLDWQGISIFPAASTIKVPILIALFQDVDAGKIRLDEALTLQPVMIASGSGDLQYKAPGTQYTALETATKMITISDNTATNMLIARLGGAEALNQRFRSWGLTSTVIHNSLPDLEGTNTTSPKDLAQLMAMLNQGELVSMPSRDRILDIMGRTVNNSLLPKGLGEGAMIAHKTGDIGSMIADAGLIDLPTGKRYIAVAMVKRPHNDAQASALIRQISRAAYQYFSQPATPSSPTSTLSETSGAVTAEIYQ